MVQIVKENAFQTSRTLLSLLIDSSTDGKQAVALCTRTLRMYYEDTVERVLYVIRCKELFEGFRDSCEERLVVILVHLEDETVREVDLAREFRLRTIEGYREVPKLSSV